MPIRKLLKLFEFETTKFNQAAAQSKTTMENHPLGKKSDTILKTTDAERQEMYHALNGLQQK